MRILAITSEDASKVEPFILEHGVTYSVGISTDSSAYGGGGIPHAYLIDPSGTVVWEGHPASLSDGDIEKATRKTKDFYVRKVTAELKPAASAFEKGKLSEAKALAEAAKADGRGDDVNGDADYILARVSQFLTFWNRTIEKSTETGRYDDVLDALEKIQKHYPDTDEATAAAAKEKELKADPRVKAEMDAWKKLDKLIEDVPDAKGNERKLKSIQKKLEKFLSSYSTSKAAKRAQQVLDAISK